MITYFHIVCPDCYQDLQREFLWVATMFNSSWEQLQLILVLLGEEATSFSDLLTVFQYMTVEVLSRVNISLARYSFAVMQYEDLIATVNQTLVPNVRQIESDLSNLRRISTTVLVLASTSEELMHRTISDFVDAEQVVQEVWSKSLNITQIVHNIEQEYATVKSIEQEIHLRREHLISQVAELMDLISDSLNHSETAVKTMDRVQDLAIVVENKIGSLEMTYAVLSSKLQILESNVTRLVDAIMILANMIQQQLTGLPDYDPLQYELDNLALNTSVLDNHTMFDIIPEIEKHFNEYVKINETLSLNIESFRKLEMNLSTLASKTSSSLEELTSMETTTNRDTSDALANVSLAQSVLIKLQNFSNDSQSIIDSTSEAADDAQDVKMQAEEIRNLAENITEHTQLAHTDVRNASQISMDALNITSEAKQVNVELIISHYFPNHQYVHQIAFANLRSLHIKKTRDSVENWVPQIPLKSSCQ